MHVRCVFDVTLTQSRRIFTLIHSRAYMTAPQALSSTVPSKPNLEEAHFCSSKYCSVISALRRSSMTSPNHSPISINELPTSPSSPQWESPIHSVLKSPIGGPITIFPYQPTTTTGQTLEQISINLESLIESNPPLVALQAFLDHYRISNGSSPSAAMLPGRIHPLVQEWFDYKDTLKMALEMRREDIATYLLDEGFGIDGESMRAM
jgi:hypothetical protein